jgi:hypothetical protein
MPEVWVYQILPGQRRRYLAKLAFNEVGPEAVWRIAEPHFTRGKSYYFEADCNIYDTATGTRQFGACMTNPEAKDVCGRCNEPGVFVRTALVCPRCNHLLGGC